MASKLLNRQNKNNHHLQQLLHHYFNIYIDKSEQLSNWLDTNLTEEQIAYAAQDVLYFIPLLEVLETNLESKGLLNLAHECFAHIPTRVQLDLKGYNDLYQY